MNAEVKSSKPERWQLQPGERIAGHGYPERLPAGRSMTIPGACVARPRPMKRNLLAKW